MNRNVLKIGCILTACAMLISGCKAKKSSDSFFAMNTYMTFTVYGGESEEIIAEAEERAAALEKIWSVTDKNSEIYKINNSSGAPVAVSDETIELIEFSLEMSAETGGAFDPTIYPVLTSWGFTAGENKVPSEEELSEALKKTGCANIDISGNHVTADNGAMLDFGGAAKGFTGDILTEFLRSRGVSSALLDIGGNIQAIGTKLDGSLWKIGLRNPFSEGILGTLEISDTAVVTSGNYERFFVDSDGRIYGHIIDPKTGYPVDNGLMSVTVIGGEGKVCDVLSTALFVMGRDKAIDFYQSNGDFDMILVTADKEIYITSGISDSFTLNEELEGMRISLIE